MGCHFLLQGIFLTQGSNLPSPTMAGGFFTTELPEKPLRQIKTQVNEFGFRLLLDVMQLTAS